ncbi:MAG: Methylamine utilization protein MauE [Solirubrobacteraceae bacterium]|nr:Methylamine utilization protein MauE [Solirubrobacteraceae bacterium]
MLLAVLLATLLGTALLVAAGLKAADRTGTAVAAGTFGLHGRAARAAWVPLVALETALAVALLAGWGPGPWAAAVVLAAFAAAQAAAIAAGRGGAPCGCFGARGVVSWGAVARTALLAAGAAALGLQATPVTPVWRAAAAAVALLAAAAVVARAARSAAPGGALEISGEGPPAGARLDLGTDVRLAFFTSAGCRLCRALLGPARELGATIFDEERDAGAWATAGVPGAPFAVALAPDGTVLAKGTVNTRRQLASVVAAAHERGGQLPEAAAPPSSSRRRFIATASAAVGALAAVRSVGSLIHPGDAEAFHFCGHVYTTDGCPHPTGLPRIDTRGFPLRAKDGRPVDDLGRPIDAAGAPVNEDGSPWLDPDGRPLPPATRTRICSAAGRRFRIPTRTDGAWFRCCGGHVRKLSDCCTSSSRRINGDRALKGYCYGRHHVFCVMYVQTRVPC